MTPWPAPPGSPTVDEAFGTRPEDEDQVLAELAATALAAALGAATLTSNAFGGVRRRVETKSSATDMVSEVDHDSERLVSGVLAERRPDDGLLGEEGASREGTTGVRWLVDPLDGTTNYLWGIPAWSVSIAAERAGRPVVGVVADPARGELWAALEGRGAYCNGVRCHAAEGRSTLATALVATGFGYDRDRRATQGAVVAGLLPRVRDIRRFGSAALDLCWVADGRFDAYYERGLNPWDLAAGTIICREAGATVDVVGDGLVVAATPALRGPLTELLHELGADRTEP